MTPADEKYVCFCGAFITDVKYEGSRGIHDLRTGTTHAPLTTTCLDGHDVERWMDADLARRWFQNAGIVGR